MTPNLELRGTKVFVYRVFDIAEEVNLSKVESLFAQPVGESRVRLAEKSREAVIMRNAPVRLVLGNTQFETIHPLLKQIEIVATLWDYGALSLAYKINLPSPISWEDLFGLSVLLNGNADLLTAIETSARNRAKELTDYLKPALKAPEVWASAEDYIIYFTEGMSGLTKPVELIEGTRLPELLVGEPKEFLSAPTRAGISENVFQYSESDLTLLDWNSAFVFEPSGSMEIPDVIEFALSHLLEVRFYDDLLDRRLAELYSSVERGRNRVVGSAVGRLSKDANARYIEFSEFTERMGNSLKVVGDFYLARIFRGALRRFRISDWEEDITRKMNILAQVSHLLQGESNVRRGHLLELIIILLILFEILSAFYKGL